MFSRVEQMKPILVVVLAHIGLASGLFAGRPIIVSEVEACVYADLVVIATVSPSKDVPVDGPFGESSWHNFGFTEFAEAEISQTLLGTAPKSLLIYGGKMFGGTDFRMEEGRYLILLMKVKDGAYRAVDWHYSFAPLKNEKVGWLVEKSPIKREWLTKTEVLRRIEANKSKGKRGVRQKSAEVFKSR